MSINTLPDDLLIIILPLAHSSQPCFSDRNYLRTLPPDHLKILTHVCSRWRQLAINLHSLWSHIDLPFGESYWRNPLDRAEIFANRAGDLLLHIHIPASSSTPRWDECSARMERFLSVVGPRIARLEVTLCAPEYNDTHEFDSETRILNTFLVGCVPGVLTKLKLTQNMRSPLLSSFLFDGFDDDDGPLIGMAQDLRVSQNHLEALYSHVTSLWLSDYFIDWTSKVYHNLAELYLGSFSITSARIALTEQQLVGILRSSPGLRAIYLLATITETLPEHASVAPVLLEGLELLSISSGNNYENIIRWLAPGRLPLYLSIEQSYLSRPQSQFAVAKTTADFLRRSNLAALRINGMTFSSGEIINTLWLSPNLRVITLRNSNVWLRAPASSFMDCQHSRQPACLLYMDACFSVFDVPRWISSHNLTKMVFLTMACHFAWDEGGDQFCAFDYEDKIREILGSDPGVELLSLNPKVKLPVNWGWPFEWLGRSRDDVE